MIKTGIDQAHPLPYWVAAEISELKVNYSGHCYLELVEKGGANHIRRPRRTPSSGAILMRCWNLISVS